MKPVFSKIFLKLMCVGLTKSLLFAQTLIIAEISFNFDKVFYDIIAEKYLKSGVWRYLEMPEEHSSSKPRNIMFTCEYLTFSPPLI